MTETPTPAPKPRRLRAKLIAFSLATLLALGAAEILARILRPGPENTSMPEFRDNTDDWKFGGPKPGFKSKNGLVWINAQGWRDSEDFPVAKPADEKRVLFIGDSFLYAALLKWEEVLPKRSEARLAEKGVKVRAHELATPGWGTDVERAALEKFGLAYSPSVVVLAFFVGNDVLETINVIDRPVIGPDHTIGFEHREESLRKKILMHSKLFRIIEATETYQRIAHPRKFEKQNATGKTLTEDKFYEVETLRLEQWRRGSADRPPLKEGWAKVESELAAFFAAARKAGSEVAVIVVPDEVQVDERLAAEVMKRAGLDAKDYDLDDAQRRVAAICAKHSVDCVDVLPAFREKGRQGGLYLELDTHWNAAGHDLAAQQLVPVLEKLLQKKK